MVVSKQTDDDDNGDDDDDDVNDDDDDNDNVYDDDDLIRSVASGSADCLPALCFRPSWRHHYRHLSISLSNLLRQTTDNDDEESKEK